MLSRTILPVFRSSTFGINSAAVAATTRRFDFSNPKVRNRKYKAAAKERRRIVRARKADENKSPHDMGEELPPFLIPPRYKLIFKYMQAHKNARRL